MTLAPGDIMLDCQTVCHVCCRSYDKKNLRPVFSQEGLEEKLPEKISKYTPFTVSNSSHPSAIICTACVENMNSWDNYIQSCIEAHLALTEENCSGWKSKVNEEPSDLAHIAGETVTCNPSDPIQCSSSENVISVAHVNTTCINKNIEKSRNTYCVAKWCNKNTGESNVSFFRIPTDRQRAEQWLLSAGRDDLLDKDMKILHSKYLCDKHFPEVMFMNEKHKRLVWNATPSIFPDINSSVCVTASKEAAQQSFNSNIPCGIFRKNRKIQTL